jgi:hypothetical protein
LKLATRINDLGSAKKLPIRVCSLEMLLKMGNKLGFSLAQGQ